MSVFTNSNLNSGVADSTAIRGRSGNISARIVTTPTITTSAYSAGQVIGGKLTLSNALRSRVLTGLIQSVSIATLSLQTAPLDVVFFSDDPTGSTITNASGLAVVAADLPKVAAVVNLFGPSQLGTPSFYFSGGLALPVIAASTTIYACIVARSAITFGTTSDVVLVSRIIQD